MRRYAARLKRRARAIQLGSGCSSDAAWISAAKELLAELEDSPGFFISPNARLISDLQTMARALTKAKAWTPKARAAYEDAGHAIPHLGESITVDTRE